MCRSLAALHQRFHRLACWPLCLVAVASLADARQLQAGDWPQLLGPQRNGVAMDESELTPWPGSGPRELWAHQIGQGYAGPAVVGNRVVVFHRAGDKERVECLDASSGRSMWQTDFSANYRGGVNPDTGPRCVPLIHGQQVFLFGAAGDLHCVALESGPKLSGPAQLMPTSGGTKATLEPAAHQSSWTANCW